jgi:hypothetical protein
VVCYRPWFAPRPPPGRPGGCPPPAIQQIRRSIPAVAAVLTSLPLGRTGHHTIPSSPSPRPPRLAILRLLLGYRQPAGPPLRRRRAISRQTCGRVAPFALHARNDNRERAPPLVHLKAICHPRDDGERVLTVMRPDED